jgi:hypothetical protein
LALVQLVEQLAALVVQAVLVLGLDYTGLFGVQPQRLVQDLVLGVHGPVYDQ